MHPLRHQVQSLRSLPFAGFAGFELIATNLGPVKIPLLGSPLLAPRRKSRIIEQGGHLAFVSG
jgi:hypothetical protein